MNESAGLRTEDSVLVLGHRGMVGSAVVRKLKSEGFSNIITVSHAQLDLTSQVAVKSFLQNGKIDYVVLAAAKVGGILANSTYPAEFIYQNLMMQVNVIHESWQAGVKNLLFLGSSCIYPKFASQPMAEKELLTGILEPTNEPYAVAKIAGIKLCESYNRQYGTDYRSVMPTNLYGPNDNFHPDNSHVIPALMRRFHEAKVNDDVEVTVWGSGNVYREFLHVDDMASACIHVMALSNETYIQHTGPMLSHINVGAGKDITIRELAEIMKEITGFRGGLQFDTSQPDGTPKKLLDVTRLRQLGWQARIELYEGLASTYDWFLSTQVAMRR